MTRDERMQADDQVSTARIAELRDAVEGVHFWVGTSELLPALTALIVSAEDWLKLLREGKT